MTTFFERALLLDVCLDTPVGAEWLPSSADVEVDDRDVPDTFLLDGRQLAAMRRLANDGNPQAEAVVGAVRQHATQAVQAPAPAVVDKSVPAPSGDPHDYCSLAKYWWPDPDQPNGPYVRHDGHVNPEAFSERYDALRLIRLADNTTALALGAYLLDDETYTAAAQRHLRRWFLDDESRQNPHFAYAQTIPGRGTSRVGVLEARHLIPVSEAIRLLSHGGGLGTDVDNELRQWYGALLTWMWDDEHVRQAAQRANNVALWTLFQRAAYADFLGEATTADHDLRTVTEWIHRHVRENGAIDQELERHNPTSYMAFSLLALLGLTRSGEELGRDVWHEQDASGRGLDAVCEWVATRTLPAEVRRSATTMLGYALTQSARSAPRPPDQPTGDDLDPTDVSVAVELAVKLRTVQQALRRSDENLQRTSTQHQQTLRELSEERERHQQTLGGLSEERERHQQTLGELSEKREQHQQTLHELAQARTRRDAALEQARVEQEQVQQEISAHARTQRSLDEAHQRLDELYASTSWRLTRPVRLVGAVNKATRRRLRKLARYARDPDLPGKARARLRHRARKAGRRARDLGARGRRKPQTRRQKPAPRVSDEVLWREYRDKGLDQIPDTFVLYRIVGNDLTPRHERGQSRKNVEFILHHEPPLPACEKRWIVNRIVDADEEAAIIALLERHGQRFIHVPFRWDEYCQTDWDFESLPFYGYCLSEDFRNLGPEQRQRAETQVYRHKNNYVMHNNGARNLALTEGRRTAKWILPWDGNCFLTTGAWHEIRTAITSNPQHKHVVVPMARIDYNERLLEPGYRPEATEEPQIVFRRDTRELFDESFPYGRRPKVQLLWRLGVPGPWDRWRHDPWDLDFGDRSPEAGAFATDGWVARLGSGEGHLEKATKESFKDRGLARSEAIVCNLVSLDARCATPTGHADGSFLAFFREEVLEAYRKTHTDLHPADHVLTELAERAQNALRRGPYSVVDKTSLPPSSDPHDYWHPAPYYWPNPDTSDGRPYIRRDGKRIPGTELYEPGSEQYDRTRLQRLFDDTTLLALAWYFSGELRFVAHAAQLVRRWFLEPETRMNPHLRFSQVRLGHHADEGAHTGIIEFKDVYYFLDAIRLLRRAGSLDEADVRGLQAWFADYLSWLLESPQGEKEAVAPNNHGTLYDLQVAAIAGYVGDFGVLARTMRRSHERLLAQLAPDGSQPQELQRTITAHYCCFNLQSWVNLADLYSSFGNDLWGRQGVDGRGLHRSLHWLLSRLANDGHGWPHQQVKEFDWTRRIPLAFAAIDAYGSNEDAVTRWGFPNGARLRSQIKPVYYPHDGIAPFWCLTRRSTLAASSAEGAASQGRDPS